jgi:hypothetical protein
MRPRSPREESRGLPCPAHTPKAYSRATCAVPSTSLRGRPALSISSLSLRPTFRRGITPFLSSLATRLPRANAKGHSTLVYPERSRGATISCFQSLSPRASRGTNCPRFATLSDPLYYQSITNCSISKSFVLITIQQCRGWVGASLLRPSRRTLTPFISDPVSSTLVPRIWRSPVRGFFSILSAVNCGLSRHSPLATGLCRLLALRSAEGSASAPTPLESTLSIRRRMRILNEHREPKDLTPSRNSKIRASPTLPVSLAESTLVSPSQLLILNDLHKC